MSGRPDEEGGEIGEELGVATEISEEVSGDPRDELKKPQQYAVILLNDDYTTMEFVVEVLMKFFRKTQDEAMQVMLHVHQRGRGVAGVYTYEIAETKVFQVHELAKARSYPMRCLIEPA